MHVLRHVVGAFLAAIPLTVAAIVWYPTVHFTRHVGTLIGLGVVGIIVLTAVALLTEGRLTERAKYALMTAMLLVVLVPTLYTVGAYIHQVQTSWSAGEVHYHADYEVIVQDEAGTYHQVDLIDPSKFCQQARHESTYMCKLNDRTGSTEYHEHNDRRIHLEGTFREREDATLAAYFKTFGGELSNTRLVYPTNEKTWAVEERGDRTLKILVERGVGGDRGWCAIGPQGDVSSDNVCIDQYSGEPARSPAGYVISPYQSGPALDDIWIIYDDASVQDVLQDLREDGRYKQFQQEKTAGAEGY